MIQDIQQELSAYTKGLLYMSESERPFEVVDLGMVKDNQVTDKIKEVYKVQALEERDSTAFFDKVKNSADPNDEQMHAYVKQMLALQQYLQTTFSKVQVYRAGTVEVSIFIVGQTSDGKCMLLHTVAIES